VLQVRWDKNVDEPATIIQFVWRKNKTCSAHGNEKWIQICAQKAEGQRNLTIPTHSDDHNEMELMEIICGCMGWIHLAQNSCPIFRRSWVKSWLRNQLT
jgi:hypothetical protein